MFLLSWKGYGVTIVLTSKPDTFPGKALFMNHPSAWAVPSAPNIAVAIPKGHGRIIIISFVESMSTKIYSRGCH